MSVDNLIYQGLEHAYNKSIYESKYGANKKFVDSLSEKTAYKDYTDRTIKELDEVFKIKKI